VRPNHGVVRPNHGEVRRSRGDVRPNGRQVGAGPENRGITDGISGSGLAAARAGKLSGATARIDTTIPATGTPQKHLTLKILIKDTK
jgi:hypothetical protein